MKKILLLLFILLPMYSFAIFSGSIPIDSTACDLIELKNGSLLEVNILRIEEKTVFFKYCGEEMIGQRTIEKNRISKVVYAADREIKQNCETLVLNNNMSYDVEIVSIQDSIIHFYICGRSNEKVRKVHLRSIKELKEKRQKEDKKVEKQMNTPEYSRARRIWSTNFFLGLILAPLLNTISVAGGSNFWLSSFAVTGSLVLVAALAEFKTIYSSSAIRGILLGSILGIVLLIIVALLLVSL